MRLIGANGKNIDADDFGNIKGRVITRPEVNDASAQEKMFSFTSAYTTSGGDEEIIYIKNTHETSYLDLHAVIPGTAANAVFTFYEVSGTAGGASAITPANLNLGSTLSASVTATGDASVTGLTLGATLFKLRVLANYSVIHDLKGSVILAPNTAIAVSNSATGACEITLFAHFNELEKS